jgi:uncharacterized protein (DUF952 family)
LSGKAGAVKRLYHIMTLAAWGQAQPWSGWHAPASFAAEGLIHCSTRTQLLPVADAFFPDESGLMVLEIDPAQLTCEIRWENLEGGGELFPHIYGRLPWQAVARTFRLERGRSGFRLAAGLPADV